VNDVVKMLENGEIDSARQILTDRVRVDIDDISSWRLLSRIYLQTKSYADAIISYGHWVRLDPVNPIASSGIVECLLAMNKNDDVLAEIKRFEGIASGESIGDQAVLRSHSEIRARISK